MTSVISANDIRKTEFPPQAFVIEPRLLPQGGTAAIAAKTGIGKSFVALHIARCLVTGSPLFGATYAKTSLVGQPMFPVSIQPKVLYVDYEITHEVRKTRLPVIVDPREDNLIFAVMPDMYGLGPENVYLRNLEVLVKETQPSVLFIDPFSSSHSFEENSSEVRNALKALNIIRQKYNVATIIIHHASSKEMRDNTGKKIDREPIEMFRGHTSIVDWCDVAMSLTELVAPKGSPEHIRHLRLSFAKTRHNSHRQPVDLTLDYQAASVTA